MWSHQSRHRRSRPLNPRRRARWWLAPLVIASAMAALTGEASAATITIGQTPGATDSTADCGGAGLFADRNAEVPGGGGTITDFSFFSTAEDAGQQIDFLVLRPTDDGTSTDYTVVADTGPVTLAGTGLETFPADFAAEGGDILANYHTDGGDCAVPDPGGSVYGLNTSDPSVGTGLTFNPPISGYDLNESATLEGGTPRATTTTAVACSPDSVRVDAPTTCTATVTASSGQPPTGAVGFISDSSGAFDSSSCTLVPLAGAQSSCSVTYTPGLVSAGSHSITASYVGVPASGPSNASTVVTVTSATNVACAPSTVAVGLASTCTATVTGTRPSGTISFAASTPNTNNHDQTGRLRSATCALRGVSATRSTCSVIYTPLQFGDAGRHTIVASYPGDARNPVSGGSFVLNVTPGATRTSVACTPVIVVVGTPVSCDVTVTDVGSGIEQPLGLIALSSDGSGSYGPAYADPQNVGPTCTLQYAGTGTSDYCTFTYTPTANGVQTLTTKFDAIADDNDVEVGGYDSHHLPSQGATRIFVTPKVAPTSLRTTPLARSALDPTARLTLSGIGAPIAGATVSFSIGGTAVCSGTTDADGVATCPSGAAATVVRALLRGGMDGGFTATYAGSADYLPASAHGSVV
jgi:hypothetical protein